MPLAYDLGGLQHSQGHIGESMAELGLVVGCSKV